MGGARHGNTCAINIGRDLLRLWLDSGSHRRIREGARRMAAITDVSLGFMVFMLFSSVIITAWLTIDDEDFNRRFEEYRKSGEED